MKKKSKDKKTFSESDAKRMEELRLSIKQSDDEFAKLKENEVEEQPEKEDD